MPVYLHVGAGGEPAATERFDHPFYTHALAHPFEQMIAVLWLLLAGYWNSFQFEICFYGSRLRVGSLLDKKSRWTLRIFATHRSLVDKAA